MRLKMKLAALAAGATMLAAGSAGAAITTFDITWSGASFGNSATAHGLLTVDTKDLPAGGYIDRPLITLDVIDIGIDVFGSHDGDGHYGTEYYRSISFWSRTPLDLSAELIGQPEGDGCTFGASTGPCGLGAWGDFSLFSNWPGAPSGVFFFTMETADLDHMLVTSIKAVGDGVPEPATWALMIGGFAGVGGLLRRRRALGGLGLA